MLQRDFFCGSISQLDECLGWFSRGDISQKYTGLIVDASGLQLNPSLIPRILDENGNEIYCRFFVNRNYAVNIGMVGYLCDLEEARYNDRVKDNPIIVTALDISGINKSDVIVPNTDALLIHAAAANLNFLERCRVIFIVD